MNIQLILLIISIAVMKLSYLFGNIGIYIKIILSFVILFQIITLISSTIDNYSRKRHNALWDGFTREEQIERNRQTEIQNEKNRIRQNEQLKLQNERLQNERLQNERANNEQALIDRQEREKRQNAIWAEERRKQDAIDAAIRAIKYN